MTIEKRSHAVDGLDRLLAKADNGAATSEETFRAGWRAAEHFYRRRLEELYMETPVSLTELLKLGRQMSDDEKHFDDEPWFKYSGIEDHMTDEEIGHVYRHYGSEGVGWEYLKARIREIGHAITSDTLEELESATTLEDISRALVWQSDTGVAGLGWEEVRDAVRCKPGWRCRTQTRKSRYRGPYKRIQITDPEGAVGYVTDDSSGASLWDGRRVEW